MRRILLCLVSLAALTHATGSASPEVYPRAVGMGDPKNDHVNPALGSQLPWPAAYTYTPVDILGWSLSSDGEQLHASITTNGRWRDWVEQLAWGTVPSMLVVFESPSMTRRLCGPCPGLPRDGGYRLAIMFRTNPCPGGHWKQTSVLALFDPYQTTPGRYLVDSLPYSMSADERTIRWDIPYTVDGYTIVSPGETLTNVGAQTMTWTVQGAYSSNSCAMGYAPEGAVDWSPQRSWDPAQRMHRPTDLTLQT